MRPRPRHPAWPARERLVVDEIDERTEPIIVDEADTAIAPPPPPGQDPRGRWMADNIDHERVFLWDDDGPVSTALASDIVAGVSRVGFVYTPPDQRGHGYAAAVVAEISTHVMRNGADRCILYTQLSNPTSNAVYQRLGYRAVGEVLDYNFG